MKLSDTLRGSDWLSQFEVDDRKDAKVLLDSIRFAKTSEVLNGLRSSVESHLDTAQNSPTAAIVPILSLEDMRRLGGVGGPITTFVDFNPSQSISNAPGSEALVANLITQIGRSQLWPSVITGQVTLDLLRERRVRKLICVTDYIGSGTQVLEYLQCWYRNRTIKSWCSLGLLRIVVVSYAATLPGLEAVKAVPYVSEVQSMEIARSVGDLSQDISPHRAESLCKLYAKRGRLKSALGFRDSGVLYATEFSVPNNLPSIFIRSSKRWRPFFDNRSVPAVLSSSTSSHRPDTSLSKALESVGQVRLARLEQEGELSHRWRIPIAVLALFPKTDPQIARLLGMDLPAVRGLRRSLMSLGLVDSHGRKTPAGNQALKRHRMKTRRSRPILKSGIGLYYPRYTR